MSKPNQEKANQNHILLVLLKKFFSLIKLADSIRIIIDRINSENNINQAADLKTESKNALIIFFSSFELKLTILFVIVYLKSKQF